MRVSWGVRLHDIIFKDLIFYIFYHFLKIKTNFIFLIRSKCESRLEVVSFLSHTSVFSATSPSKIIIIKVKLLKHWHNKMSFSVRVGDVQLGGKCQNDEIKGFPAEYHPKQHCSTSCLLLRFTSSGYFFSRKIMMRTYMQIGSNNVILQWLSSIIPSFLEKCKEPASESYCI